MVNIGFASSDEFASQLVQLFEIVRSESDLVRCVSKPFHTILDVIDEFLVLLDWVSVIIPQVRVAAVLSSHCEVEPHGFSMANVQVTIGLRRESGNNSTASGFFVLFKQLFSVFDTCEVSAYDV